MTNPAAAPIDRTHRLQRMGGRDPHEAGRTATSLELLFDLVFVVAISQASSQLAHLLAEGHLLAGIGGFLFAMYAICWAWISFTWFSSAFDTDDWVHRLATMVQMVGAAIMALGLPAVFHALDDGHHGLDNQVVVAGYVVMRVAMVFQWLRAARQSPRYRKVCLAYVWTIVVAQVGWVLMALLPLSLPQAGAVYVVLLAVELLGPYLAETRYGGTPWHAHHIAERYGLLTLITLGEGVVGTVASLSAVVQAQGWSTDAVMVAVAGMGITFGMWWVYFVIPTGEVLHRHRERVYTWAYGGMPIFATIAATGAGLDVAAMSIQNKAHLGPAAVVATLALPVALYLLCVHWMYWTLYRRTHRLHVLLVGLSVAVLAASVLLAAWGASLALCLLVVMLAPALTVTGYETRGYRHIDA